MLIVATQDTSIREWCEGGDSNATAWGNVLPIDAGLTQAKATAQLRTYLGGLKEGEHLCIVAHGNDEEIGDSEVGGKHWGWTFKQLARMVAESVSVTPGKVLIEACGDSVSNFSAKLVVKLEERWAEKRHLDEVTVYGYHRPNSVDHTIPSPDNIEKSVEAHSATIYMW